MRTLRCNLLVLDIGSKKDLATSLNRSQTNTPLKRNNNKKMLSNAVDFLFFFYQIKMLKQQCHQTKSASQTAYMPSLELKECLLLFIVRLCCHRVFLVWFARVFCVISVHAIWWEKKEPQKLVYNII